MKAQEKDASVTPGPSPARGISAQSAGSSLGIGQPFVNGQGQPLSPLYHDMGEAGVDSLFFVCNNPVSYEVTIYTFHFSSLLLLFLGRRLQIALKCHTLTCG